MNTAGREACVSKLSPLFSENQAALENGLFGDNFPVTDMAACHLSTSSFKVAAMSIEPPKKIEPGKRPKVVIVGGGFGGLYAAKGLSNQRVDVTLIDRKNHHTFQPLLYQVALAVLSPGEISNSLRQIFHKADNVRTLLGEVVDFDLSQRKVILKNGKAIDYDYLIVAAGARHSYFGHDEWEIDAPGLKTLEDAVEIRRRLLLAFETAEKRAILTGENEPLHFTVVGGGPTGVELA